MINKAIESVEAAITPSNPLTFLLDWELTMKCNLDCSYCGVGENGGHDNSTQHPKLSDCLSSLDFMFEYADLYTQNKRSTRKQVILNVYGGESLHHPDIVEIFASIDDKKAKYTSWNLTVTCTTNALVTAKKLLAVMPYIQQFTISYHTESNAKQQAQFKENLLLLKQHNKEFKCLILMNPPEHYFRNAIDMIEWCKLNGINYLPKQLDIAENESKDKVKWHSKKQIIWFNKLYSDRSFNANINIDTSKKSANLSQEGRACCGGRQTCTDQDYKTRHFYIDNHFPDWYCSVNEYFLFVKQVNGKIYTNKDCKMNFDGQIAPIGNLNNTKALLDYTRTNITNNSMPIIQCKSKSCLCGLCAPKAQSIDTYRQIMLKYKHEK